MFKKYSNINKIFNDRQIISNIIDKTNNKNIFIYSRQIQINDILNKKGFNLNLHKFSNKNFCHKDRKSLKWYWREKTYDMQENETFKNYKIKFKDNFHMELIPIMENNKKYDSVLIWLYDGDFPEYFIDHLLEFNNFPPKVN